MINSIDLLEGFAESLGCYIQHEYINQMVYGNKDEDEFDWDKATEAFIRSEKGFIDKRRFKGIDLDKFIKECFDILSEESTYSEVSSETKELIFKWMYKDIDAVNLNKVRVLN
jgi:hypothetical protein